MPEPISMSIKQFCQTYGLSRSSAYELLAAGKLKALKAGGKTLILKASADEWLTNLPAWRRAA